MKLSIKIIFIFLLFCQIDALASKNIFWEVNSKSGTTVYLLGSIHMADSTFYPLDNYIEDSFNKSDYLVTEIDIKNVNPMSLLDKMTYPFSDSLSAYIADTTMEKLVNYFSDKGMNRIFLNRLKPAFIVLTISNMEYLKAGITPEYGIDLHFTNKIGDKELIELETADYQINVIDMLNKKGTEDAIINSTLDDIANISNDIKEIINNWKQGDIIALEQNLAEEESTDIPENEDFNKELIDTRNMNMTKKIISFLETKENKKYFVIVGAAHLIGDNGIIRLLEKDGFKPKRK